MEKYQIYEDFKKVPVDVEHVRSAFNMSKKTTKRLRAFSQEKRIPLQTLVELAVMDLLEKYDN